jgi:hypothetical protein
VTLLQRRPRSSAPSRSLESVAIKEEAIEKAEHGAYMAWCASRNPQADRFPEKKTNSAYAADTASTTQHDFVNTKTKSELLNLLRARGDGVNDFHSLQSYSVLDV